MSEEVGRAIGDVLAENATLRVSITELTEIVIDLQLRNHAAQADSAALREALVQWIAADGSSVFSEEDEALAELAIRLRDDPAEHPGAALLAELAAARALRAAVRPLGSMAALNDAAANYDAAKAR